MNCFTMLLFNSFITKYMAFMVSKGFGGINEMNVHIRNTNMLLLRLR